MDRERRNRIGRNDPCHCGSGKKFKRCHGQILDPIPPLPPSVIPPEVMQRFMERHKADELRRESQQGLGKPIVGTKFKDYQLVAVGNRVHYGKWGTFYDFLGAYIRQVLTAECGNSEIASRSLSGIRSFSGTTRSARCSDVPTSSRARCAARR